jgi:predicted O-methyltransferase YrrM
MDGNHIQRLLRLAAALGRRPWKLVPYLHHLPLWRRSPIDLELPWFSYGAIDYLARTIKPDFRVFEFGSGGSTLFFARRAAQVVCVENDANWHRRVQEQVCRADLTNVDCQLHSFGDLEAANYKSLSYFDSLESGRFDLIVVDGFCGFGTGQHGKLRPYAFAQACAAVKRPGIVVLDDFWMFPEVLLMGNTAIHDVFQGVGPCRYGVTSTAVFRF